MDVLYRVTHSHTDYYSHTHFQFIPGTPGVRQDSCVLIYIPGFFDWPTDLSITDYQYQTAAQSVDQRTAVGLARTLDVDLRFFLPPPALPKLEDVSGYISAVCVCG